jgi:hypothetical protein
VLSAIVIWRGKWKRGTRKRGNVERKSKLHERIDKFGIEVKKVKLT